MTGTALVAPVESSREVWTSGLADSIEGWVDDALAGAALGVEVAATVMDSISALLANNVEAIGGLAAISAAVVKWTGRILTYTLTLVNSLTNLTKLLNG